MIDIHCHLLPGLDDGPSNWEKALSMARMAVQEGFRTIIATPHQLGSYRHNSAVKIRRQLADLQQRLQAAQIPLQTYAGGDVRIESDLVDRLRTDDVLTLADRGRHVLLELPHELCFPLGPVLRQLQNIGLTGILSHPERNLGILAEPDYVGTLIQQGCLMQVTADSLLGRFGAASQRFAETMLQHGQVHFVASDAHDTQKRPPRIREAYRRIESLTDRTTADNLCLRFPAMVTQGQTVPAQAATRRRPVKRWFGWSRLASPSRRH